VWWYNSYFVIATSFMFLQIYQHLQAQSYDYFAVAITVLYKKSGIGMIIKDVVVVGKAPNDFNTDVDHVLV
jgi:hypothetical protein